MSHDNSVLSRAGSENRRRRPSCPGRQGYPTREVPGCGQGGRHGRRSYVRSHLLEQADLRACAAALLPLLPGRLRQHIRSGRLHGGELAVYASFRAASPIPVKTRRKLRSHGGHTFPVYGAAPALHGRRFEAAAYCSLCDGRR
jgi:hypothetical protein